MRELTERLTFQSDTPVAVAITSLTRAGGNVTAVTATAHDFDTGDVVLIAGATPSDYNGEVSIAVVDATSFVYPIATTPSSPASGTMTATFVSDAQGGQGTGWRTAFTVSGAMEPLTASELLQAEAINSIVRYRGKIRYRADVSPKMRVQWTPFRATTAKTLEVHGVLPDRDFPRDFLVVECGEVVSA